MKTNTYQKNLLLPTLKLLIDAVMIEGAFLLSFYLRFHSFLTGIFPVTKGYPPFHNYLMASFLLLLIYLILFSIFNSYRSRYFSTFTQDIPVVLKTCFLGILFSMSGAFLYRGFSYSRLTFLLVLLTTIFLLLGGRYFFHRVRKQVSRKGVGIQKFILLGSTAILSNHFKKAGREQYQNFSIVGYCAEKADSGLNISFLGQQDDLESILRENQPDGLIMAYEAKDHYRVLEIMKRTEGMNVELFYMPDLLDMMTAHPLTMEIGGLPAIRLKAVIFSGWQGFLKRSFDLLVSLCGTILLSPFLILTAILIKLTSRGPVFYRQNRIGLDGREFEMIKFRSMVEEAEKATGPVWTAADDRRVTKLGKFLRRTSIDELPQLINVMKGDMSLVGPRPERKFFVEQFQQEIPKYAERHRVRSGMTGWAQVNGLRGQSPIEERTRYDVYYIENWSLWFDIKIILMTFMAIQRGENAY